ELDVASPPALEPEIPGRFGVDLGIEVVLFGPQRVGRILVLEILYQPGAVEYSVAEIAGKCRQPAATQQAAAIAHRIFAVHAGPVRQRRSGNDNGAEEFWPDGGENHDRPPRRAIADPAGLAVRRGMQRGALFEKARLGARDVLDRLAGNGMGKEADEIAGMSGLEGHAVFAVRFEAAD